MEVISPTITIKVVGHQWYWSSIHHEINLGLATEPVAGRVDRINQLELIERSFIMSSLIFSFKRNVHIPSISRVSSINHDKTYSVINKGLNHPSISLNVKTFLNQNKNLAYPYLFTIDDFNVPKGKNSYLFSNKYKPNSVEKKEITNIAGVYLIRVLNTYDYYIGSATNLFIRFLQHRDKGRLNSKQKGSIKLYTMIRNLYPSNVSFEVLQHSTNFLYKIKELQPNIILNTHEIELMQLLTSYECAVKEQSFLKFFKPSLNDRFIATTSTKLTLLENTSIKSRFLLASSSQGGSQNLSGTRVKKEILEQNISNSNLSITDTRLWPCKIDISNWNIKEDDPVKIFNIKGVQIGSFLSNRKAAQALGVSHTLISRYAKSINNFLSPRLDIMVSVKIINVDKLNKVKHPVAKKYPILDINLTLPKGKICAISSDLSQIKGIFESFQEAANFFEVSDYRRIRRYFGTQKLIKTFKGSFYFTGDNELIKYYETKKSIPNKSIIVHDLSETSLLIPTKVYSFIRN